MTQKNVPDADAQRMTPARHSRDTNLLIDIMGIRRIAILVADGVDDASLAAMEKALAIAGAKSRLIAPRGSMLTSDGGLLIRVDHSLLNASSVMFDAVYVPGGANSVAALRLNPDARHFIREAYRHCKAIAASGEGSELVTTVLAARMAVSDDSADPGLVLGHALGTAQLCEDFIRAIARHRHRSREMTMPVPA